MRGIPGDSGFFVLREPILLVKPFALRNVVDAVDWPNRTRFQPLICARDAGRFQVRALLGQCFLFAFIIPKRSGSKIGLALAVSGHRRTFGRRYVQKDPRSE